MDLFGSKENKIGRKKGEKKVLFFFFHIRWKTFLISLKCKITFFTHILKLK